MTSPKPVPSTDLLAEANDTLNVHWLRSGQPWEPCCPPCADGDCPDVREAEAFLDGLRWLRKTSTAGELPC